MGAADPLQNDAVVLLHGIARTAKSLAKLATALQREGFFVLNLDYPSRKTALNALADIIHPQITEFAQRTQAKINFVGHSMGGLLIRAYVARHRPANLGRVVMLGTPNQGSEVADLLRDNVLYRSFYGPSGAQLVTRDHQDILSLPQTVDFPVGIIAGTRSLYPIASAFVIPGANDGRVSVARTKIDGMADHLSLAVSHPTMVRNREVVEQTIHFLRHGRFRRGD